MRSLRLPARLATIIATISFVPFAPVIAESLPDMRPALAGSARNSLVNLIDTQALVKRGMQHGAVLFQCLVLPSGSTEYRVVYGGTPGSEVLREEVKNKFYAARFTPAVYHHHYTYAWFYGTVTFSVVNGKPHLCVYANQEKSELAQGSNFISPQSIYVPGHHYEPRKYPEASWETEEIPGTVDLEMTTDSTGKLKEIRVLKENPPGKHYGESALKDNKEATFLPAFRNGRPVESTWHIIYIFMPNGWHWKP